MTGPSLAVADQVEPNDFHWPCTEVHILGVAGKSRPKSKCIRYQCNDDRPQGDQSERKSANRTLNNRTPFYVSLLRCSTNDSRISASASAN
jgi:hypothetical protein